MYADAEITIDLGKSFALVGCASHQDEYMEACRACQETPPRPVDQPALNGKWVKIRNPLLLPWGAKKALAAGAEGDVSIKARLERSERIARELIIDWNLEDVQTGEKLPVPSEDPAVFDRAPDVVTPVLAAYNRGGDAVPKATATS